VTENLQTLFDEAKRLSAANDQVITQPLPSLLVVRKTASEEDLETVDLEKYFDTPRRAAGFLTVTTADAFVDYVLKHMSLDTTLIVADEQSVTAVFNHHQRRQEAGGDPSAPGDPLPGWSDFGVKLSLQYTPAWTGWKGFSGQYQTQESLANWLEENQLDVIDPGAGHLLDVVTNLRLASNSKVSRRINLSNGAVRFQFEEDFVPAGGGEQDQGILEVPPGFRIRVQVFRDGSVYELPLLLRYRVNAGEIQWMFKFTGELQKIFDAAFDEMTGAIAAATGVRVYRGKLR
jgi:uncharacterized protein YfdQ (DUF2303 family)